MTITNINDGAPRSGLTLSIIIVTFDACDVVIDCLNSIYKNPPREPYEIFVVDNGSIDGTSEILRARYPEVHLIYIPVNGPYAVANNLALKVAKGDFLCLLNNDTIVLPEAFDKMIAFLRERPDAGAVGCQLLNEDGSTQISVKPLPSPMAAVFGARSIITKLLPGNRFSQRELSHLESDMKSPSVVGYISGAACMHPRQVVAKVGELDPQFFYFVDADYCKRIADASYKCYYLPSASIVHLNHKGGSLVSLSERVQRVFDFHGGAYRYYRKHIGKSSSSMMHAFTIVGLALRFVAAVVIRAASELIGLARTFLHRRVSAQ